MKIKKNLNATVHGLSYLVEGAVNVLGDHHHCRTCTRV